MIGDATTDCFQNVSEEAEISHHDTFMSGRMEYNCRTYTGWMTLPLAIFGLVLTIMFLAATIRAIRLRRVSRKYHVLLINRSVGDLFTSLAAFFCSVYVICTNIINKDVVFLIETFFICSFWSAVTSYTTMSMLKLYAVWKPIAYRVYVTMRRCIYLIALSWCIFLLICAVTLGTTALVKVPLLANLTGCKTETCLRTYYRVRNVVTDVTYFFTVFVFIVTVFVLRRNSWPDRRRSVDSILNVKRVQRFPLWRLGMNVGTFALFHGVYVGWAIYLLTNHDRCYFIRNFTDIWIILSLVRASLLLRIIADDLLTFVTDSVIRKSLLEVVGGRTPPVSDAFQKRIHIEPHEAW